MRLIAVLGRHSYNPIPQLLLLCIWIPGNTILPIDKEVKNMLAMDLALRFMQNFYSAPSPGQGLQSLRELLAEDLQFRGPFVQFDSAAAYMESLLEDPPRDMRYEIMHSYADENSACLIYRFEKPNLSTVMAQVFETRDGKISKIRLIFDSAAFVSK